jgi:hypothetical protein
VSSDIDESSLICLLIKDGLIRKLIDGLKIRKKIAYRYHFRCVFSTRYFIFSIIRLIAEVLRDTISNVLRAQLANDVYWNNFVTILDELDSMSSKRDTAIVSNSAAVGSETPPHPQPARDLEPNSNVMNNTMFVEEDSNDSTQPREEEVEEKKPEKRTWKQREDLLIAKLEQLTLNDHD